MSDLFDGTKIYKDPDEALRRNIRYGYSNGRTIWVFTRNNESQYD